MLARVKSAVLLGLRGTVVEVEVDIANGLPAFDIVGLPDTGVRESRERVRAAIRNAGLEFPMRRITVNLTPADLRKEGPHLDLPIAVAVLAASGQVPLARAEGFAFLGALSLGGEVRPVAGILPLALAARAAGIGGVAVPAANSPEATLVEGPRVIACHDLREVVAWLQGREGSPVPPVAQPAGRAGVVAGPVTPGLLDGAGGVTPDLSEVRGQRMPKRVLEIAAAGGHNVLFVGPPGAGKTLLARCLPSILPPLAPAEALELTAIYSASGLLSPGRGLIGVRPFRAPHHSASVAAMVGGGPHLRPGEVTLAHHGVLFLDEVSEFARDALEALRQPLEDGGVCVSRARATVTYPARFTLVAATNPCPCGLYGDSRQVCTCAPTQVARYRARLSGPLRDRIDLHIEVGRLAAREMTIMERSERSAQVRERVAAARERQAARLAASGVYTNAQMGRGEVRAFCRLDAESEAFLLEACEGLAISLRGCDRVLRVARTIADLEGAEQITLKYLSEALLNRGLDRDVNAERVHAAGLVPVGADGEE